MHGRRGLEGVGKGTDSHLVWVDVIGYIQRALVSKQTRVWYLDLNDYDMIMNNKLSLFTISFCVYLLFSIDLLDGY